MTQHYTRSTVSASAHCPKCGKQTQHRVDDGRLGPCLECIEKLDKLYEDHKEFVRTHGEQGGFEWT